MKKNTTEQLTRHNKKQNFTLLLKHEEFPIEQTRKKNIETKNSVGKTMNRDFSREKEHNHEASLTASAKKCNTK